MYINAQSSVKLHNGITETFKFEKGIKQGDTLSPYLFNLYINDINDEFCSHLSDAPSLMKTIVGCLLYADDLLILSETKEGLQHSLDNLYNYCSTWKLQLNVKKTNIVIFSSRQHSSQYDFKFGPLSLRIADTSSYLGITFHKNGNFTEAVTRLKEKSNKAMFSLSQALYSGITFDPKLPLKVFDSTIRPILTYGSEVWCSQYKHLLLKPNQIDKMMFENINNRFCKFIMGLPRQASNFGIKAELGRPPIFSFMCAQLIRYWFKIINVDSDRILKDAYLSELHICNKGGASWVYICIKTVASHKPRRFMV